MRHRKTEDGGESRRPSRFPGVVLLGLSMLMAGCGGGSGDGGGTPAPSGAAATPAAPGGAGEAPATTGPASPTAGTAAAPETGSGVQTASGGSTPATPPAGGRDRESPVTGTPQLSFETTSHDFGSIVDTERVETGFAFTNTGSGNLVISEIKGSCGCTVASLSKRQFKPGEGDVIKASFDPKGRQGRQTKYITVISNSAGTANQRLTVTSMVEPMLTMERMVNLGVVPLGTGHKETLELTYLDPQLRFLSVQTNNPHLTAEVVEQGTVATQEGGITRYKALIELTLAEDAPWGLLYANRLSMSIKARPTLDAEPMNQPYTVHISGRVFGEIQAQPALLSVGTFPAGESFEKALVLSRGSGEPMNILEVEVAESTMPGVQVRFEPVDESSARLIVSGDTRDYKGSIRGQIAVRTDVQDEGQLMIRFAGFARPQ